MPKRYIFPDEHRDRKKTRLDISLSDHNFPLSQNTQQKVPTSEPNQADVWGDDNDDEILLLASQACEQAYESILPDYSMCMQPPSTSTQMFNQPSTSKSNFNFKKPNFTMSMQKEKYDRISSPLPGLCDVPRTERINLTDDLIVNENIFKGQDTNFVYKQLLQLQEENAKLKSENGKLLEKCVTKEGEASILRTQLKSCHSSVDNARMERLRAQEKLQLEWTEKLTDVTKQMHDLRTQLDFKNVEIISMKERCKMLESNKVKLTHVTVSGNDITASQRRNSVYNVNDSMQLQRKVKTTATSVQTADTAVLLKLNTTSPKDTSKLSAVLPLILEPTSQQQSLLEYNDKLHKKAEYSHKCRIFSTFHRIPNTPSAFKKTIKVVDIGSVCEDLTSIAAGKDDISHVFNVFSVAKTALLEVERELEDTSQRMTTAFQKEMDERYIETSNYYSVVTAEHLLRGRALYKEEQALVARRMLAILSIILESSRSIELLSAYEDSGHDSCARQILDIVCSICNAIDSNSCAVLFSGLILSILLVMLNLVQHAKFHNKVAEVAKHVIASRPMMFVHCHLAELMRKLALLEKFQRIFCARSSSGNLKTDYDQGVFLYKKGSCIIQILLKQIEGALKCIERQQLRDEAVNVTASMLLLHSNMRVGTSSQTLKSKCGCDKELVQVLIYALRICGDMFIKKPRDKGIGRVCTAGVQALYARCAPPAPPDGHLLRFVETMATLMHHYHHEYSDTYGVMVAELAGAFQGAEDAPAPRHRPAWDDSFALFSVTD